MRKIIIISIFVVLIGLFIVFSMLIVAVTGSTISNFKDNYTYTRAICSGNKCIDYYISCSGGEVSAIRPISGLAVFDENWTDPRDFGNESEDFCSR